MIVIGLISGTSVDGIDAALIEIIDQERNKDQQFSRIDVGKQVKLLAGETFPYPRELREQILAVCGGKPLTMAELAALDDAIAEQFADAAKKIQRANVAAQLIGSHGQTVFHRPPLPQKLGYSVQLGRGEAIASFTGIPVVSNFRAADIAAFGHGAPLVPKVDAYLLSHPELSRCIQNIGGIANVTYLRATKELNWDRDVLAWDTGPGNALLDLAISKLTDGGQSYDRDGQFARSGTPCTALVNKWLQLDFFQQPPPKSTGRELFGLAFLEQCSLDATARGLAAADLMASLTELTVASIVHSYQHFLPEMPAEVLLCGGGSKNLYLKQRLQESLAPIPVLTTSEVGVNGDFKEAYAFAILAYWRLNGKITGNLPQVTGAKKPMLLGFIHQPN
ncbi:MAG: anhydro-N-acetylmuramic acid kinase [Gomphosphaeria aponina SAG 52.96 = DSM 107014]|uniref:Anhydro-N-acetylmuramic acid kinase n=1 Tax=Gomphosphaeria aponina SAG 52.96 = DSM 107014 TaxID=1521640 RepID=A0A941JTJ1_9CHRO|nr:anhydro-N-acetylmuramic acid kinase [Gomphosphaeria aponina SAG 52.96 = DSM 107014]